MARRTKPTPGDGADREAPELVGLTLKPAGLTVVEQEAFHKLMAAIAERRLSPGVRLVEEELADVFAISRERIRRVLLVLSQHGIVKLEPNRGASVARPSQAECRSIFEVRRVLERHVVWSLATLSPARRRMVVKHLRRHVEVESQSLAAKDRSAQVRLSGEFHLKLAAFHGNPKLLAALQDYVAQLSLSMAAHTTSHALDCSIAEHVSLLDSIDAGDPQRAASILDDHLDHIETALSEGLADDGSLASVLNP